MKATDQNRYLFSRKIDEFLVDIYQIFKFIRRFFSQTFTRPFYFWETTRQCYEVGLRSLTLITLTGFVTGIVFTKQSRPSLTEFGAVSWLPSLISIAIVRALAPLVTALITAGKVGSSIGAEIGSMKVTEQIDAMEVSAINSYKYLVVTRVLATTITVPILAMYFAFVAFMGSYWNVSRNELTSFVTFFENAFTQITFLDVFSSFIKSLFFGFTVAIVGCYMGYNAKQGTQSVGRAANSSVVISMFIIFIEEILFVEVITLIRTWPQ